MKKIQWLCWGALTLGLCFPITLASQSAAAQKAPSKTPVLLFLGDSLTEGYRVETNESYPSLVIKKLRQRGLTVRGINAGLSGDTSRGGLNRFPWYLKSKDKPTHLFLALGANDGLRGITVPALKKNLSKIITRAQAEGLEVMLAGMQLPLNYGKVTRQAFAKAYFDLAKEHRLPFYPFLLAGVAGEEALNLADGIHPNPKGYEAISEGVVNFLLPVLKQ